MTPKLLSLSPWRRASAALVCAALVGACGGAGTPAPTQLPVQAQTAPPAAASPATTSAVGAPPVGAVPPQVAPPAGAPAAPVGNPLEALVGKVCGHILPPVALPAPLTGADAAALALEKTKLFVTSGGGSLTVTVGGVVKNTGSAPRSAELLIRVLDAGGKNVLGGGGNPMPDGIQDGIVASVANVLPGQEAAFVATDMHADTTVAPTSKVDVKPYVYPGLACQQPFEVIGEPQIAPGALALSGKLKNTGADAAGGSVSIVYLDGSGEIVGAEWAFVAPSTGLQGPIAPGQVGEYSTLPQSPPPAHARTLVSAVGGGKLYFPDQKGAP